MRHAIIKNGTTDEIRVYALECRLSERFMDIPQLSVKVSSPIVVNFEIGDYITYDYNGIVYTLRDIPESAKNARPLTYGGAFVYNLVFYGPEWHLRNTPFRDLVEGDNVQHFTSMPDVTTYEDVYGIAARIQACMDDMYPGEWVIRVVSGLSSDSALYLKLSEAQDFSISDGKCIDALSQIYSQWGISFIYSYENGKHVITIGGVETQEDVSRLFMYGRGNGLRVIKKSIQNASEIATRFFVYGGTQNMQSRYYNGITASARIESVSGIVPEEKLAFKLSGLKVVGDNMYIPNLMIPFAKWAESRWFVWGDSDNQVFTESREPQIGDYVHMLPNIGSVTNLIQQYYSNSDKIVVGGITYDYLAKIYFPDIRKAYIDAPSQYIAKYGIRPAVLRFDGSNEREDIYPSIKGLTIGNIRAGLSSGSEYYPSESVYTDANERVDEVLSCENPQDNGLSTENGNKYIAEDTVSNTALSGEIKLVPMTQEEGETPMRGYQTRGMHFILGNYANTEVIRKGYLDFQFPLALTVENGNDFNITAEVQVFKTDAAGHVTLIINYTTTNQLIKGNPESVIYLNAGNSNGKQLVNEGDKLTISVGITASTTLLKNTLKWSVPAFTMIWRYELSLGEDFYIELKQIGFDISKVQTNDGEYPIISMTSGQCGGYEFDIHDVVYDKSNDSWLLRCARVQDSVLGQWFPNSIFKINADPSNPDTFVLLNIALPGIYIRANEQRLYDAALAERLYEERPLLEPEIDNKVMAESPQVLHAGMWFQVKDSDLGLTGADDGSFYILIDSIEVTDKPDSIRTFKVTLRNEREDNIFTSIQRRVGIVSNNISVIKKAQTQKSVFYSPTKGGESGNVSTSDFVTLSTAQTITGKKTFAEDAVFGADGSRLFIPSGGTPGTYDIFVDPGMAVEGEEPSGGGGGSGEWETWEDAAGTDVPVGFHLLTSLTGQMSNFNKGHIYFNEETGILYVALRSGSDVTSLKPFAGRVDSVSYNAAAKTLIVRNTSGTSNTLDLSGLSGQPLWCGRVSSSGVDTRVSGTLTITVNRSNEGVYGIKGAPVGRTVVVSPLDYSTGSASFVKAPHIAVVSQSSTGILTVRMYTLDGTLDDFGFSLMIM